MPGVCCECVTFSFTASPLICSLTLTLLLHEIIYLSLFISAEHGTLYFETSAKTGANVKRAFAAIAAEVAQVAEDLEEREQQARADMSASEIAISDGHSPPLDRACETG